MFPSFDFENITEKIENNNDNNSPTILGRIFKLDYNGNKATVKMLNGKPVEAITLSDKVQEYIKLLLRTQFDKYNVYKGTTFGMTYFNYLGHKDVNIGLLKSEFKREIVERVEALDVVDSITDFTFERQNTTLNVSFKVNLVDSTSTEINESVVMV